MNSERHILNSISVIMAFFLTYSASSHADAPVLPEVIVTANRSARFLNSRGCDTTVLTGEDIRELHLSSIPELLQVISSVDLTERGTPGSQADVTLRGSSFEGVLVLVNGINVRDPQTGHFTMDIPVDIGSIERVEILTGGGSTMYGSSATGGVINIVTRSTARGLNGTIAAGSYGSAEVSAGFGINLSRSDITVHLRKGTSDGYSGDSDLTNAGADVTGSFRSDTMMVDWNLGILDKQFGAEDFYAPYLSFEKTRTVLGGVSAQRIIGEKALLRFRIGARGHDDDFILDRANPAEYRNIHFNRSLALSGEFARALAHTFTVVAGIEGERTGITSERLGHHADWNNAVYGECTGEVMHFQVSMSLRFDGGFRGEQCLTHGAGIVLPVGRESRIRLRTEKSFRSPTYTELYYNDPANHGNPMLKSEQSNSFEAGFDYTHGQVISGLTVFTRKSLAMIDWIRDEGETIWRAENHGALTTTGFEVKTGVTIGRYLSGRFSAMILDQEVERRKGIVSKYALNTAESTVSGALTGTISDGIAWSCLIRYENMRQGDDRTPVTVSCSKTIQHVRTVASVRNVFNERYDELPGLRAPGRWMTVRLEYAQ